MFNDKYRIRQLIEELASPESGKRSVIVADEEHAKVVLFAFAAGAGLAEHVALLPAIIQIIQGEAKLIVGDEEVAGVPGTWIKMVAKTPHSISATAPTVGRFYVEHPTLLNLGFEWSISADANRNATVSVEFRDVGQATWRQALPLVRSGGENVYRRRENLDSAVPDGSAGSILNLPPGTECECHFEMDDPDGVDGRSTPCGHHLPGRSVMTCTSCTWPIAPDCNSSTNLK